MAGAMHPPFRRGEIRFAPQPPDGDGCAALLCPSSPHKIFYFAGAPLLRKERMRRARWKRENGGALDVPPFFTHAFGPRRGAGGGFGGCRVGFLLFSLPLPWRLRSWCAYRFLSAELLVGAAICRPSFGLPLLSIDHPAGAAALGGPFLRAETPFKVLQNLPLHGKMEQKKGGAVYGAHQ